MEENLEEIPPRPRGDRTDDATLEQRVDEVISLVLQGWRSSQIVKHCETSFGVCRVTAFRYLADAKEKIRESNAVERDLEVAKAKARYEGFIKTALEEGEIQAAIASQDRLVKLFGLAAPDELKVDAGGALLEGVKGWLREQRALADEPAPISNLTAAAPLCSISQN